MLQTGQVLFRRLSVNFVLVLPFKDSQGGTSALELSNFKRNSLRRYAPVKKQTQYADRAKAPTVYCHVLAEKAEEPRAVEPSKS